MGDVGSGRGVWRLWAVGVDDGGFGLVVMGRDEGGAGLRGWVGEITGRNEVRAGKG